jgi:hypothetical protein
MADRPDEDLDPRVGRLAVERARRLRYGGSARDRWTKLVRRLALAGIGAVLALGFHSGPYKAGAPVCDGKRMHPGDHCMVTAPNSHDSGIFDYDQMQVRARSAHQGDVTATTVLNDVGWAVLSVGGLGVLAQAAGALRRRRPWGTAVDRACPRCGRAALRERRVGVVLPGDRVAHARLVTLCTAECGHAEVRRVPGP